MPISVTTGEVTGILNYKVTLHGEYEIYGDTEILVLGFDVGQPNMAWASFHGDIEPKVTPFEQITYPFTILLPNTYYEYRAFISAFPHGNPPYQSYLGEVRNFTTAHLIVTTQAVTDILTTSVTANGTITDICVTMERGFEYYKDGVPETPYYKYTTNGQEGAYSKSITGLLPGTKYYIRSYVRREIWDRTEEEYFYYITTGEWVEFTTEAEIEITTQGASVPVPVANPAYCEWATGNGTIVAGENITERGFEIEHEFSGNLYDAIVHSIAGFEGDYSWDLDAWAYVGTLTKTETEGIGFGDYFETGAYDMELGRFPAFFADKLFAGESYTYRAYMVIDDTSYYGGWVEFSLGVYTEDDAIPPDDLSEGNPTEPIIPIEDEWEFPPFEWEMPDPEFPPWILPDLSPWEFPDFPPMSFVGDFYYRKPYTKKDLDDLRKKCIIYSKNSIEFALVLRHNMNVLREFFNMMTDYMDKEEFNDFTDLIPPQRLKELYLDPLDPTDFRDMINGFIRNTIDNNIAVNRNFKLIQDGLSDYETESDDAYFKEINSNIKTVTEDDPDVHRLKKKIDSLNQEVSMNFGNIMHNLKILRTKLLG